MAGINRGINEDLDAGGVPLPPPNAEEAPEEEVVAPPPDPEDHLLDQQPGPANQNQPRPSSVIPGIREGSTLYTDGNGYYYYAERVNGNRRFLKCSEKNKRKCLAWRPEGLRQFFSIHILYMDVVFPVAFFLMKRKTEDCYRRILQHVRDNYVTWQVTTVTTDFETALRNAVTATFQGVRHQGCWFHFCQAVWRRVMAEGLTSLVRDDVEVKKVVRMVMALPHLPPQRGPPHSIQVPPYAIVDGLNAINNYIEEGHMDVRLHTLIAYVRRFWLGIIGVESLSTFNAARRTNNALESFQYFAPYCKISKI